MSLIYAPATLAANGAKWKTITKFLNKFGLRPFPPRVDSVLALGAALRAGGYRSAQTYLSLYRTTAVRNGYDIDPAVAQAIRDMSRACARGLGGPIKARPLQLDLLHLLPGESQPWAEGGPVGPRNFIVCGSFWLLREVEASNTRAALVEVSLAPDGSPRARWHLPASKSDQGALGVARSHGCSCARGSPPSPRCPAHAAWDQLLLLRRLFPERWSGGRPAMDLPMFPSS